MLGIFDSGVGGLTVVRAIEKRLPNTDLIFFGDTARAPYGTKGEMTIRNFAEEAMDLLIREGATAFIVACHTMSALAIDAIRKKSGEAPIFDVVSATVGTVKRMKPKTVGVIGTRATVESGVYERALAPIPVSAQACPLLVPLIEEGWAERPETQQIIRSYLDHFRQTQIDGLVLGCTHYPLVRDAIAAKMGSRVRLIDPSNEVADSVAATGIGAGSGKRRYLFSDITTTTQEMAARWLGHTVQLEQKSAERF